MLRLLTFFSILLLAFSCKKKDFTFILKGNVSDSSFSTSLAGGTVTLEEILSDPSISDNLIHTATINSDGTYEISFARREAIKYKITVAKNSYFDVSLEIPFQDFSTEKALVKDFSTSAKAWAKLTFVNDAPNSPTDQLVYTKQQGKTGCAECCSSSQQTITGTTTQSFYCINDGNTTYSYLYTTATAGSIIDIYTPAFDTTEYILHW